KAYSASRVRASFLVVGLARSSGSVLTNPTLRSRTSRRRSKRYCSRQTDTFRLFRKLTEQLLYQLIRQSGPIADRQFEIEFLDSGVEAFALTFG
ncbi:MAG TPA: hypothetical protein VFT39_06795, partial [Vicinamibacterales bacterium]|nr:hypothetical protein [Vicinamibacterales bacterium]